MAFTTTKGSGATDATSFVGTAGVDSLNVINSEVDFRVEARASADIVLLQNFTNVVDGATVFGGAGDDNITTAAANTLTGAYINGNKDVDTIGIGTTSYSASEVYGGQGADILNVNNLFGGFINGNKDADTITTTAAGNISGDIYGGQGSDTININGNVTSGSIRGDKDIDILNIGNGAAAAVQTFGNATFNGNAGDDQITFDVRAAGSAVTNTTVFGGAGADVFTIVGTNTEAAFFSGDNGNDTITKGGNGQNDTMLGGAGTDTITSNTGTNRIESGTEADSVALGAGTDSVVQSVGDSNAATATVGIAAGTTIAGGDTVTVNADVISGFLATDRLVMGTTTAGNITATGLVGVAAAAAGINIAYGTWNDATNVFTFQNDLTALNDDVLVFTQTAAVNLSSTASYNTNAVVLEDWFASGGGNDIAIAQFA